jgi:hypothetical protein
MDMTKTIFIVSQNLDRADNRPMGQVTIDGGADNYPNTATLATHPLKGKASQI